MIIFKSAFLAFLLSVSLNAHSSITTYQIQGTLGISEGQTEVDYLNLMGSTATLIWKVDDQSTSPTNIKYGPLGQQSYRGLYESTVEYVITDRPNGESDFSYSYDTLAIMDNRLDSTASNLGGGGGRLTTNKLNDDSFIRVSGYDGYAGFNNAIISAYFNPLSDSSQGLLLSDLMESSFISATLFAVDDTFNKYSIIDATSIDDQELIDTTGIEALTSRITQDILVEKTSDAPLEDELIGDLIIATPAGSEGDFNVDFSFLNSGDFFDLPSIDGDGFALLDDSGNAQYWDINYTGEASNKLTELIFHYDDLGLSLSEELLLDIFHYENGDWTGLGGVVNTELNTILVYSDSFSPFVIGSTLQRASTVPTPSTVWLICLGFLGFIAKNRGKPNQST